jgi:GntR family transcriptional regulator
MAELNRQSPLPLYAQLAQQVESRIRKGTYALGSTIPSEHSLCDEFGVGRPTVRQATDELVRKGLIERRRGQGTFVRNKIEAIDLFSLGGTMRSFSDRGLMLRTQLMGQLEHGCHEDGRDGVRLRRIAHVGNDPVLIEDFWFDGQVFDGLETLPLSGQSLSLIVQERYGLAPLGADQVFSALHLSEEQAKLLDDCPGAAALCVQRSLHFSMAKDAVLVRMICKQDARYKFFQTIGGHIA